MRFMQFFWLGEELGCKHVAPRGKLSDSAVLAEGMGALQRVDGEFKFDVDILYLCGEIIRDANGDGLFERLYIDLEDINVTVFIENFIQYLV